MMEYSVLLISGEEKILFGRNYNDALTRNNLTVDNVYKVLTMDYID